MTPPDVAAAGDGGNSSDINREYYEADRPGRHDYWRYMAAPRARVRRIVEQLQQRKPHVIVDLGCGGGELLEVVEAGMPASRLVGVDLSKRQTEENRVKRPQMEWFVADLSREGALGKEIAAIADAVIASEVIEHVDDPVAFLKNARFVARPGALLIVTTQSGTIHGTEVRVGHRQHFTADMLSEVLKKAGWKPLRVWNEGYPFHDLSKWYANLNTDATLRRFSDRPFGPLERLISFALRVAFRFNSRRRGAQLFATAEALPEA
jgi:2-polyprenyl-3-methyl-5-hydroxy-6-metoxy-1,4-benzoquinol methylase